MFEKQAAAFLHTVSPVHMGAGQAGNDRIDSPIRHERNITSQTNLIALLPYLTQLQVYDNSTDAAPGTPVPDPRQLLQMEAGRLTWPTDLEALRQIPDRAKPVMEAALTMG